MAHQRVRHTALPHMVAVAAALASAWVPEARGAVGVDAYMELIASHRFTWAPPGMGIDTHRCWESLLAGTVLIVLATPIARVYEGLNVVQVASYQDVAAAALNDTWAALPHEPAQWLSPRLFAFYWLQTIEDAAQAALPAGGGPGKS